MESQYKVAPNEMTHPPHKETNTSEIKTERHGLKRNFQKVLIMKNKGYLVMFKRQIGLICELEYYQGK